MLIYKDTTDFPRIMQKKPPPLLLFFSFVFFPGCTLPSQTQNNGSPRFRILGFVQHPHHNTIYQYTCLSCIIYIYIYINHIYHLCSTHKKVVVTTNMYVYVYMYCELLLCINGMCNVSWNVTPLVCFFSSFASSSCCCRGLQRCSMPFFSTTSDPTPPLPSLILPFFTITTCWSPYLLCNLEFHIKNNMVGVSSFPPWLEALLSEKFFVACGVHVAARKNEKNILCLDCCLSICPHCLPAHRAHRLIQIRRYVYHDVIRQEDMQKLIDCAFIQAYIANGAKVVFLNRRPQTRPFRSAGKTCSTCDRGLQEPYLFCSLACKLHHLVKKEGSITKHLKRCDVLRLPEVMAGRAELDDGQMTPDSILESPAGSFSSGTGSSAGVGGLLMSCRTLLSTATTEFVRKKRSSIAGRTVPRPACPSAAGADAGSRRKGVPNRAPLY